MSASGMVCYTYAIILSICTYGLIGYIIWTITDVLNEKSRLGYIFMWPIILPVQIVKSTIYVLKEVLL